MTIIEHSSIKVCTACGEEKQLSAFDRNLTREDGRMADCKVCRKARIRSYPAQREASTFGPESEILKPLTSQERRLIRSRRAKYGITLSQFDAMVTMQHGACAICGEVVPASTVKNNWHVDHDHATGKVRGLLCQDCNLGLGRFKDNPAALQSAIYYLALHDEA